MPLGGGHGWIAFGRFLESVNGGEADHVAVVCNNLDRERVVSLRLRTLGVPDGDEVAAFLVKNEDGFREGPLKVGRVKADTLDLSLSARSAVVLI